jgi:cytochrome P450
VRSERGREQPSADRPGAEESMIPDHVDPTLCIDFDFRQDPAIRSDPWSYFHALANEQPPIFFSTALGGFWVLNRPEILAEAWTRHELFGTEGGVNIPKVDKPFELIPINVDPPRHRPYQQILTREMFAPRIVDALSESFRSMTRARLDALYAHGRADFNAEYAYVLPVEIFMLMLGVPVERRQEFAGPVEGVFRGTTAEGITSAIVEVAMMLDAWIEEALKDRYAPREAHLLEAMMRAEVDGVPLSKRELSSIATMLLLGGLDTVTSATLHHLHFLATHPEHRDQLLQDPSLIPNAVEELLRRFGVANVARTVRADCEFHGVEMRAGEMVMMSTTLAGLSESVFPEALEVDFSRPRVKAQSLAFGKGIHMCSGHALARRELLITIEEVLPRLPGLRLAADAKIEYASGGTLSIASALPLEWDLD